MLYEHHLEGSDDLEGEHHLEGSEGPAARTVGGVTTTPIWFGDPDQPLFGWFEYPSGGTASAGVVICPALAVEGTSSQPALRALGNRLAADGYAVLRFDYAGTGDSAGDDHGPARVAAWLASIRTAIHFLEAAGCAHIALVGLRIGATLAAAELSAGDGIAAAVLWDPYPTGRSFVRQQGMLARVIEDGHTMDDSSVEGRDDGSVEGPGIVMSPETVSDLRDLKPSMDLSVADRLLVLTRAGRSLPIGRQSSLECDGVDRKEVEGQETLVDVEPVFARIPQETLELIVGWLRDVLPDAEGSVLLPEPSGAIVGRAQDGRLIRERAVLLGPNQLFGIETAPEAVEGVDGVEAVERRPCILFLNAGLIDHVGPARTWVTVARALAGRGFRTVRFDLSGVGASPLRPGADSRSTVTLVGIQDVADAQRAVSPAHPSDVVLVGLCSGGYHCSEAALSTGALGVVMINPSFRLLGVEGELAVDDATAAELERQVDEAPRAWVKRIPGRPQLWELVRRAPDPFWTLVNRLAISHPPADTLKQIRATGADVFVACDDYDAWVLQRGARRDLRRSRHPGRVQIEVVDGMDHTLFFQKGRQKTIELVVDHIAAQFSPEQQAERMPIGR